MEKHANAYLVVANMALVYVVRIKTLLLFLFLFINRVKANNLPAVCPEHLDIKKAETQKCLNGKIKYINRYHLIIQE